MNHHLLPCDACNRHVRASDTRCPFCDAAVNAARAAVVPAVPTERLSRAAMFVFGATVAAAACVPQETTQPPPQAVPVQTVTPPIVVVPQQVPSPPPVVVTPTPPAPTPHTGETPPYIAPPAARYGAPPRPNPTHGPIMTRYGAPPVPNDDV
jgi:hypothetical protein